MTFNLEEEYGGFLDTLTSYISMMDDEPIEHFGVKGMKWGVRKNRSSAREPLKSLGPDTVTRKTASGEEITLSKQQPNALHKFLGHISKGYREQYKNSASLSIKDGAGKTIGHAQVTKKNSDELNLVWLGINKSARGKGYATAVMKAGADFGRQEGFKKLTLEVPGNAPDARHIYEKLGFKVTKEPTKKELEEDFFWGGLTEMEYNFNAAGHAGMSYLDKPDLNELAELVHFGVKGMKWGVRRKPKTTEQRIAKVTKKIESRRFNGQMIYDGAGLSGWAAQRKIGSKHPYARARASVLLRGATEAAVILGGGNMLINKMNITPQQARGAKISVALLATTTVGKVRINELRSISQAKRHAKLINERIELQKQLKAEQKAAEKQTLLINATAKSNK